MHAYAIVPQGQAGIESADFLQSARLGDADYLLGTFLRGISAFFVGILVVDDDLARRGDPGLDDASFVQDRVIRWSDLRSAPEDLMLLIRRGASGYPLNAFICGGEGSEPFYPQSGELRESEVNLIASEVRVIIHSIYDAESFLILVFDDRLNAFLKSLTRPVA
ncbi:hypothetical protein [Microbacterium sp. PMB16]|uniref:hypothetical protein n=1 Tax=Microbacterium sp. PMB16 TaxID=3120157 RepID=UPI003F4C3F48